MSNSSLPVKIPGSKSASPTGGEPAAGLPTPAGALRTKGAPVATYDFAHELNNLIAIISGYSELCATQLGETDAQFRKHIDEIRWAARRASEYTRQLLALSRTSEAASAAAAAPQPISSTGFPRGTESVLVIEDEKVLRELLFMVLEQHGYRPTLAADGFEAVKLFGTSPQAFDLVMLDLQLPGLPGLKVLEQIKEVHSSQKIIAVSGNITPEAETELLRHGVLSRLAKPYNLEDLGHALRAALAASAPPAPQGV